MDRKRRKEQKRKEREERLRQQKHAVRSLPVELESEEVPDELLEAEDEVLPDLDGLDGLMEDERRLRDRLFAAEMENATPAELDAYTDEQWDAIRDERLLVRAELAQEMAFQAIESDSLESRLLLAKAAMRVDPHCFDACTIIGSHFGDREKSLSLIEMLAQDARENLADIEPIDDEWHDVNRRPLLRALGALSDVLAEHERFDDARAVYAELLRRCPSDPLGVRHAWIAELLERDETTEAARLLEQFEPAFPTDPVLPWLRALERVLAHDFAGAMASVREGRIRMPSLETSLFAEDEGDDEDFVETEPEAVIGRIVEAPWRAHPEAWSWLRVACAVPG